MAHAFRLVRPAVTLTAALLAASVLQSLPAAADPGAPSGPLSVVVSASSPGVLGSGTQESPARLGRVPGATDLDIAITNQGTESLRGLAASTEADVTGSVTQPVCDFGTPGGQAQTVDGDPVLEPQQSVHCTAHVSGVLAGLTHHDVTTVSGTGVDTGDLVSASADFYATAVDQSVEVGDLVWLDSDGDGVQDAGEHGIAGVTLTIAGPDGQPVHDYVDPDLVVGPRTTADDGSYTFGHLPPLAVGSFTVTVVGGSSALKGLVATKAGVGSPDSDSSTGTATSTAALGASARDLSLDFGYVQQPVTPPAPTKAAVALRADASPATAVKGSTITVKGSITRAGKAFATSTVLEFQRDGSSAWNTVKSVRSSTKGALSASLKADRSGSFRYRFAGNSTTESGVSAAGHVVVRKATVRLSVNAPGSVTMGGSVTVKGSIEREGKKFRTTTLLEFQRDGRDAWNKVKSVQSSSKGALSTSVKPSASGSYRYRFAGNSTTDAGASKDEHVVVKPKPQPRPKPKKYKNCTELNKVYPHGVGRSGAKDKTKSGSDPVTDFVRDTETYKLNTKSDRDKDGIACER